PVARPGVRGAALDEDRVRFPDDAECTRSLGRDPDRRPRLQVDHLVLADQCLRPPGDEEGDLLLPVVRMALARIPLAVARKAHATVLAVQVVPHEPDLELRGILAEVL